MLAIVGLLGPLGASGGPVVGSLGNLMAPVGAFFGSLGGLLNMCNYSYKMHARSCDGVASMGEPNGFG